MKPFFAAVAVTAALTGHAVAQDKPSAETVLATVNGTEITLGHVIVLRSQLPEQYQSLPSATLYQAILDQIIQQEAVGQTHANPQARAIRLSVDNDRRAFVYADVLNQLQSEPIDDAALAAAYEARIAGMETGEEWNASHILVETEDEAKALVDELTGGADFAELAKAKSTGPSGPRGGELGWFSAGMMVPPFEMAVEGMEVGGISGPVQTQFGWHVIRLNDKREVPVPTLEEMHEELETGILRARVEARVQEVMSAATITRAEVEIDPEIIRDVSILDD